MEDIGDKLPAELGNVGTDWRIDTGRQPNFEMAMGDGDIIWALPVAKTWRNRIKWWLFFRFFPFKLIKWEKEDGENQEGD